jgi:hypothetical protein
MHKNAMKCNKTQSKWCIKKHGASKIIDTFETYQTCAWPLGWRGTPWRPIFVLSNEKCVFLFRSTEIEFLCEAASETVNGNLRTTPHINNRPFGIHISALVSSHKPSMLFSGLCASSYQFCWNRGGFAL